MFGLLLNSITSPLRMLDNTLDILDGLTEGEIREKAVLSLGFEVVSEMTQIEVLRWYNDNN